jgi:hypothetical protein
MWGHLSAVGWMEELDALESSLEYCYGYGVAVWSRDVEGPSLRWTGPNVLGFANAWSGLRLKERERVGGWSLDSQLHPLQESLRLQWFPAEGGTSLCSLYLVSAEPVTV